MKNWKELSVLIVGCGSAGKRHARVLATLGVKDVRACDPNAKARTDMAAQTPNVKLYESYDEGLSGRPDTVLICTGPDMHVPMAIQALRQGHDVLTEKPLSDTTEGVDELKETALKEGKKVMVALCFRYHIGIVTAREYLRNGRVGRLACIRASMGEHFPEFRPDYRQIRNIQILGAFDMTHDLDLALWFADSPVKSVQCLYGNYSDIGIEAPDLVQMLIDFDGTCVASVHLDLFQRPRRRMFELICTEGLITVDFGDWNKCTVSVYESKQETWYHQVFPTDRDDMFRAEDREFLQAVAEDLDISCDIDEGLRSLDAIMKTGYHSKTVDS